MNTKYLVVVVAAVTLMFMGATALATGNAIAYEKSQAVSQVNDCGNGGERSGHGPMVTNDPVEGGAENVGCQNAASQIQGDDNSAVLYSDQFFD